MYVTTLGAVSEQAQIVDFESTFRTIEEQARQKADAAVQSVSFLYRSAARRWVDGIVNEITATREILERKKNGVPLFARDPQHAERMLRQLRDSIQRRWAEFSKAADHPFVRALTWENFIDTTLDSIELMANKAAQIAVVVAGRVARGLKEGFLEEAKKDPKAGAALAALALLGGGLAVAYVVRAFK